MFSLNSQGLAKLNDSVSDMVDMVKAHVYVLTQVEQGCVTPSEKCHCVFSLHLM